MNNLLASEATFTVITSHSPTSHSVLPYARRLTQKKKEPERYKNQKRINAMIFCQIKKKKKKYNMREQK